MADNTTASTSSPVTDKSADDSLSQQSSRSSQPKEKKPKQKKNKSQQQDKSNGQKPKPKSKVEKPFYQTLGESLLESTRPEYVAKSLPPVMVASVPIPPVPTQEIKSSLYQSKGASISVHELFRPKSAGSIFRSRRSEESSSDDSIIKPTRGEARPTSSHKSQGAIYNLKDFDAVNQTESLILRYGRVAHMGVRDPSYSFWMNKTRSAVVHFKVLNKVAVLGGDPLCHPDRIALTLQEFEAYCKQIGWKTAVIGASTATQAIAKARGNTTMHFGTETVLNPQTNEVLVGKSGKRIVTQCRQLLDPSRGGITIHTYNPSLGRDASLESDLRTLYDDWRNNRNTTRESQAFITVFDLFAMPTMMTFLYTRDREGTVNGFAALRNLGANNGYHIDPFIQSINAPRGVSDLLIFSSLSMLHVQGCSYLSLGFEPLASVGEISGMPSALHSTTRAVYKHVFGKIPVGGKEAFHARWKPDTEQESPLYLIFAGRVPSPRFMVALTHFANISLRQIIVSDLTRLTTGRSKSGERESEKFDEKVLEKVESRKTLEKVESRRTLEKVESRQDAISVKQS